MHLTRKLIVPCALAASLLLASFVRYSLLQYWPKNGNGQNYVLNLEPNSFPLNGTFYKQIQRASADWALSGGTSFVDGYTSFAASSNNHFDHVNTWELAPLGAGTLGVTFAYYVGNTLTDCDVQLTNQITWQIGQQDPNAPLPGADMRGVARHECGHAIGFEHEDMLLDCMNSYYTVGSSIPHAVTAFQFGQQINLYGQLPHADDKFGCRAAYPPGVPTPTTNIMCTSWRDPVPFTGVATKLELGSLSYGAGDALTVPCTIENQSNVSISGGGPFNVLRAGAYLSTSTAITTSSLLIGQLGLPDFGPHATGYFDVPATIPANTAEGTYYIGVIADSMQQFSETHESDNLAWYGPIAIHNKPDLIITGMQLSDPNPVRGSSVVLSYAVQNVGLSPSVPTGIHLYLMPTNRTWSQNDYLLGAPGVPALQPGEIAVLPYTFQVPPGVCGGFTFYITGDVDLWGLNQESNTSNNHFSITMTPQWPAAPGLYVGNTEDGVFGYNPASGLNTTTFCSKAQGISFPPTTQYYLLWTCSGTSPGVTFNGIGTLHLNWDVCTQLGILLEGSYFNGTKGPVNYGPAGNLATMTGGPWIAALQGIPTHFTTLYIDFTAGVIRGFGSNAERMFIY